VRPNCVLPTFPDREVVALDDADPLVGHLDHAKGPLRPLVDGAAKTARQRLGSYRNLEYEILDQAQGGGNGLRHAGTVLRETAQLVVAVA